MKDVWKTLKIKHISPEFAGLSRALESTNAGLVHFTTDGKDMVARACADMPTQDELTSIVVELGGAKFNVVLSSPVLAVIIGDNMSHADFISLNVGYQKSVLDLLLFPLKRHFQARVNDRIVLASVDVVSREDVFAEDYLSWNLGYVDGGNVGIFAIRCLSGNPASLSAIFNTLPKEMAFDVSSIPLIIPATFARSSISLRELKDLRKGDIIFCEDVFTDGETLMASFGNGKYYSVTMEGLYAKVGNLLE